MTRNALLLGSIVLLTSSPAQAQTSEISVLGIRPRRDANEHRLVADQARRQAGTQDDPVKAIENLPGLARSSFGSNELLLWGASGRDSRVYVDGVEIPQLFHGSGIRSTVNGDLLQSVTLAPGAYGADYGRGIGGMVRLETRELPSDRVHVSAEASTLDASLHAAGRAAPRVRVALAGRYGLLERTLSAVGARDVSDFFAVPRYLDYQAKAQLELRAGESLDLVALGSSDDVQRSASSSDPDLARSTRSQQSFQRVYLRYRRVLDDGAALEVVPWVGRDVSLYDARFGSNPAALDQRATRYGLRAEHRARLAVSSVLRLGLDAAGSHSELTRRGSLTIPAREGDLFVLGQPPSDDSNADRWQARVVSVAPYAALDWDRGPLSVVVGLRFAGYLLEASRSTPRVGETPAIGHSAFDLEFEPRLSARLALSSRVALLAAGGVYSQAPSAEDLSAVFGSPSLGPERAFHATLAESVDLSHSTALAVTGFYRSLSELTVRDPSPSPELAHALLQSGAGKSYGVQALLSQKPWHGFGGSLSYTISRSERRDTPAASMRLFDYDQPHVLSAVASQTLGQWSGGLRFRYASGSPRTPVVGAFFDESQARMQPIFGPYDGDRLPAFWQLDARIDREWRLAAQARLVVFVELLNVTNHRNGEEYQYSRDYSRRALVTGLPFVGVVGGRLTL